MRKTVKLIKGIKECRKQLDRGVSRAGSSGHGPCNTQDYKPPLDDSLKH